MSEKEAAGRPKVSMWGIAVLVLYNLALKFGAPYTEPLPVVFSDHPVVGGGVLPLRGTKPQALLDRTVGLRRALVSMGRPARVLGGACRRGRVTPPSRGVWNLASSPAGSPWPRSGTRAEHC